MANLSVDPRNVRVHHHQRSQGSLFGNPGEPLQYQQSENQTMRTKPEQFIDHRRLQFQPQQMVDALQNKTMQTKPDLFIDDRRRPFDETQQNIYFRETQMKVNTQASYNVHRSMQQQRCRYYAEGRCYYGKNCKFSHEMTQDFDQRDRERWDYYHHRDSHQNARPCRY